MGLVLDWPHPWPNLTWLNPTSAWHDLTKHNLTWPSPTSQRQWRSRLQSTAGGTGGRPAATTSTPWSSDPGTLFSLNQTKLKSIFCFSSLIMISLWFTWRRICIWNRSPSWGVSEQCLYCICSFKKSHLSLQFQNGVEYLTFHLTTLLWHAAVNSVVSKKMLGGSKLLSGTCSFETTFINKASKLRLRSFKQIILPHHNYVWQWRTDVSEAWNEDLGDFKISSLRFEGGYNCHSVVSQQLL